MMEVIKMQNLRKMVVTILLSTSDFDKGFDDKIKIQLILVITFMQK